VPQPAPNPRLNPDEIALPDPYYFAPLPKPKEPQDRPNIPTFLDPVPDLGPIPKEELDPCDCKRKTKDKDKKKRKPRVVCYRGTYRQTKGRTIFTPKEEVPCEALKSPDNSRLSLPKARGKGKRKKNPTIGDLAKDIFGSATSLTPF